MYVQNQSNASFVLYLNQTDLCQYDISPDSVTPEDAIELFKSHFQPPDSRPYIVSQIELFPGKNELMMFIHTEDTAPALFSFEDIEQLISAAAAAPESCASSLLFYDGDYIMAVWPPDSPLSLLLSEYGRELLCPSHIYFHILEHGKTLIMYDAIKKLKESFSK